MMSVFENYLKERDKQDDIAYQKWQDKHPFEASAYRIAVSNIYIPYVLDCKIEDLYMKNPFKDVYYWQPKKGKDTYIPLDICNNEYDAREMIEQYLQSRFPDMWIDGRVDPGGNAKQYGFKNHRSGFCIAYISTPQEIILA